MYQVKINDELGDLQSKTISFLRFPLIVCIVMIHAKYVGAVVSKNLDANESLFFYNKLSFLISDIWARMAVPTFFLISGFLFFHKTAFSLRVYQRKMKSRVKSILVPYLFWNILILFLYWGMEFISVQFYPTGTKMVSDYSLLDFLYSFWNTQLVNPTLPSTGPMNPQFWYLRDLMVMFMLSPILFVLISRVKEIFISFLFLLYVFNIETNLSGFSMDAICFFSLGAYLSIEQKSIIGYFSKQQMKWIFILYFVISFLILFSRETGWGNSLVRLNIVFGVVCVILISARQIEKGVWKTSNFLSESSFFIYAYHELVLMFLIKLTLKGAIKSDVMVVFLYFAYPMFVIVLGLLLYYVLKEKMPALNKIVTGNR